MQVTESTRLRPTIAFRLRALARTHLRRVLQLPDSAFTQSQPWCISYVDDTRRFIVTNYCIADSELRHCLVIPNSLYHTTPPTA